MNAKHITLLALALLLASCQSGVQLQDFDQTRWQSDTFGCQSQRLELYQSLLRQREQLIGLSQHEIIELLGQPDEHELYQRTRKFFYYHLDPAPSCDQYQEVNQQVLSVRFNALDMCNEVIVRY